MKNLNASKSAYIKIMLNIKNNAYKNNRKQLAKDYEILKEINKLKSANLKKSKDLEKLMAQMLGVDNNE